MKKMKGKFQLSGPYCKYEGCRKGCSLVMWRLDLCPMGQVESRASVNSLELFYCIVSNGDFSLQMKAKFLLLINNCHRSDLIKSCLVLLSV